MSKAQSYAKRFERVFDYIDTHHAEPLSVERLSQVANFSKYHFHRQFSEYCGITVARYILLVRLRRASFRLAFNPLERIAAIALDAGFESPEAFSRAFKNTFDQTPSEFRKSPAWEAWTAHYQFPVPVRSKAMDVRIVNVNPIAVAVLEHRGDPALLNGSVARFMEWRKESGLSPVARSRTFGVPYNDPNKTPPAEFRFDICGSVHAPVPANRHGLITKAIPGGRCAMTRHLGSLDRISDTVYGLYRDWLPRSGEECRDFPVYFKYMNLKPETQEHALVTNVYLPLK